MYEQIQPFMGFPYTISAFVIIILGGLGNLTGSLAAGMLLGVLETFGIALTGPNFRSILIYGVLITVLLVRPQGLFGGRRGGGAMRGIDAGTGTFLIALLALIIVWPWTVSSYFVGVGFDTLRWAALALSWLVLSGMTGYFSFGHVVFFGWGAYMVALTWLILPLWACILVAGAAAGLLALLVGYPCLRVRGPYFVILTFGIAEFVKFIVINIEAGLSMSGRMLLGGPSTTVLYYSMAVLAIAAFVLAFWVRQSRFGAGLRAIRADEDAAETLGVPVTRYKLAAFVLSAIIPGMVGALFVVRGAFFRAAERVRCPRFVDDDRDGRHGWQR